MNRRQVIVAGGTVSLGALAGCLGSAQSPDDEDGANSDTPPTERTITVTKSGEVAAEPDLAILHAAIESSDDDAQSVRDELATRSADLQAALVEFGIDEDDITTARYDINERREEPTERPAPETDTTDTEDGDDSTVTYEGVHEFAVEVTDVDEVGAVIDTAVDAGADSVNRVQFTLSDDSREDLREEAIGEAMTGSRSEAELLAGEADSSIVDVRSVESTDSSVRPVSRDVSYAASDAGDGAETELTGDDVTVVAQVTVTYDIE